MKMANSELLAENIDGRTAKFKKLKLKLKNVLHQSEFCAICYEYEEVMVHLDDIISIEMLEGQCLISIRSVLNSIFDEQIPSILPSNTICDKCKENTIRTYTFVQNTLCSAEILANYLGQLNSRLDDIGTMLSETTNDIIQYANTVIVINDPPCPFTNNKTDESQETFPLKLKENTSNSYAKNVAYICDYCKKEFVRKNGLIYHIKVVHSNSSKYSIRLKKNEVKDACSSLQKARRTKKYECPECDTRPCAHNRYLLHYKSQRQQGKKTIKCPDCIYVCQKASQLVLHANHVHLKALKIILCEVCAKPLYSKDALKIHMRNFHTQLYSCDFCQRQFKDEKYYALHKENCRTVVKQHRCELCPASFDTGKKLMNHVNKHVKEFACNICSKVFSNKQRLGIHQKMHENTEPICKFKCYTCKMSFSTKTERESHIRAKHNPDGKSKCVECNIEFDSFAQHRGHLLSAPHMLNANPNGRLKHQCNNCDYSTTSMDSLEGHINRFHLKIAPYPCPECDKKFTVARKLKYHLQVHAQVKTRQCEVCGKYFSAQTAIKKHMRLHTGEKPYGCDVCGDKFSCTAMRDMHKMKKHSVKTIRCPLCESMFYTVAHMRCHFKKVHWKLKGEAFDIKKVKGLTEADYELFRDKRLLVLK